MCVSKLAHKGGRNFFLVLISIMQMACGSYSEKLHVIPVSHLESLAAYLRAWSTHYLLESAVSSVVCISEASVCGQAFISLVKAASPSHAGVGRYERQLSSTAVWCNWNMTQVNWLLPGCGRCMLVNNGTLVQFQKKYFMEEWRFLLWSLAWSLVDWSLIQAFGTGALKLDSLIVSGQERRTAGVGESQAFLIWLSGLRAKLNLFCLWW